MPQSVTQSDLDAAKGAVDEAREPQADPVPEVQAEAAYNAPPEVYAEYEIPEIDAEAQWVPEVEAEAEWAEPEEGDTGDGADADSDFDPDPMM